MMRKTIIALVLLIAASGSLIAQDPQSHEKRTYVDENGKIFWNKSLPVYITISTSPNAGGEKHILKTAEQDTPTPYYFDTEGVNWIRTRWKVDIETGKTIYPQEEVLWPVYSDGMSPKTSFKFDASSKYVSKGITYYTDDLKLVLNAKDEVSGVENIYYNTGNGFLTYSEPVPLSTEKEYTLSAYSVDKVGNAEALNDNLNNDMKFTVDGTAPISTHAFIEPKVDNILSPKSIITLSADDAGSGLKSIQYTIDDGSFRTYTSKISPASLSDGDHTLKFYSTDHLGNKEEVKSVEFYLDKTPPVLTFDPSGDQYVSPSGNLYVSGRSSLTLSAEDNKAGVETVSYQIDKNEWAEYSSSIPADQKAGIHTLYYHGVDRVKNKSVTKSKRYIIDTKEPIVRYSVIGPEYTRNDTLFVNKTSKFRISPSDEGSYQAGVKTTSYVINGASTQDYSEPFTMEGDGYRAVKMIGTDQVNNEGTKEIHVLIDNDGPALTFNFSVDKIGQKTVRDKNYLIYPSEAQLFLAGTDVHVGTEKITYSINGGTTKKYISPVSGFKKGTNYEIKVTLHDKLGNTIEQVVEFSVE